MALRQGTLVRMVRMVLPTALGLLSLVLIIAWLSGAFTSKIPPERTGEAARRLLTGQEPVYEVHEVTKDYVEEAVGTLKAASRTEVSARILATISDIAVTAGDTVSAGDVLVILESQEVDSRVEQAEQALLGAAATLRQAETDFARIEELKARNVATQAEFDAVQARLSVARAEESRAQRAVDEARIIRSYTTITAPKAGRVVDRLAEPGDTAQPGIPLLVIYDAESLRLEAPALEKLAVQLKPGDRVNVFVDALDRELEATIDQIVPQADVLSRSFLVKAKLPAAPDLYEGMFGRLLIPAGVRRHVCLAESAIERTGQLEFVHVVRSDNTVERRMIRTGRPGMPGLVEVLSGLRPGERVLVAAQASESSATGSGR